MIYLIIMIIGLLLILKYVRFETRFVKQFYLFFCLFMLAFPFAIVTNSQDFNYLDYNPSKSALESKLHYLKKLEEVESPKLKKSIVEILYHNHGIVATYSDGKKNITYKPTTKDKKRRRFLRILDEKSDKSFDYTKWYWAWIKFLFQMCIILSFAVYFIIQFLKTFKKV
ncbi:MAG: hypothetical protein KAR07_03025 [Spirochaetes bacterium]|nr:hypothetical protein [Spirochaetota bacterium]